MSFNTSSTGWLKTNLGSVIELNYGKSLPAKTRDGGEFPVFGSNGVVGNHSQALVKEPGIVVGRKGSFGEVQFSDKPFYPIDTTYYVDQFHGQPVRYWYYQLVFLPLNQLNRSTAIPGLNREDAYAQDINLPPLAEQKVIADKLDTLLAQVDNTKARLERIPEMLKRFRQSVLAAAVSGRLTEDWRAVNFTQPASQLIEDITQVRSKTLQLEVEEGSKESSKLLRKIQNHTSQLPAIKLPDNWTWTTFMSSMERVVDCHNKTAPYIDAGIPLIRTPDIRNGEISLKNTKHVSDETYEYWSRRCPPQAGDILFTREAPMGEAGIVPDHITLCMGQRMMLLRPIDRFVKTRYLLLNILSLPFQQRMAEKAVGTGVKHLRVSDVESLTYPLPPSEEQTEIVRRVDQLFAYADTVERQVNSALERVNQLTQSILAKAFRGELTAQWREDNPELISGDNSAEALLERIKAERAAQAPTKRTWKKATA